MPKIASRPPPGGQWVNRLAGAGGGGDLPREEPRKGAKFKGKPKPKG